MVPRHEYEFLTLVLLALPPHLQATFNEECRGTDEEMLWTALTRIRAEKTLNPYVAIELEILASAFTGVSPKDED